MKMKVATALLACVGTVTSMSAWAGVTAEELVGTWKSPQSLDTYLVVTQTPNGLVMSEVHQNYHGGSRVENEPITLHNNRLDIGTWSMRYDDVNKTLVSLITPPSTFVIFSRTPQPAGTRQ
ncbi:hypothetical protein [Burkholderia ubonensis]|uniref:hypothetical protein n=1 Tax=Burkholderia ubonensis TaxID=101571 RepID=UPI0007534CAB|nr:hypothetical protein [Burkholderia ubonensis]KVV07332.1 hypothetical protein WK77_16205 [Burkholderia ubonensis]